MHEEIISVIIPVYNVINYLPRCVESLLGQSHSNIKIVLVDDGSSDGSSELCDRFANEDGRIRVIHQSNSGVSAARNCGINESKGDYIAFIDSDDYVENDYLKVLYYDMVKHNVDIVCCNYREIANGRPLDKQKAISSKHYVINKEEYFDSLWIDGEHLFRTVWGKLFRREVIRNHYFTDIKYGEDTVFLLKIYEKNPKVYLDTYLCYNYIRWYNSTTMSVKKFDIQRGRNHIVIGNNLWKFAKDSSIKNQSEAIHRYALYVYTALSYLIKSGDRINYKKNREIILEHSNEILKDKYLKGKLKIMLKIYSVSPEIYWYILRRALIMKNNWMGR